MTAFLHRKTIQEGAAVELTKHLDDQIAGTRELTDILRDVPLKKDQVARKFAADGLDETKAIATAQRSQEAFEDAMLGAYKTLEENPGLLETKTAKRILNDFRAVHDRAMKGIVETKDAAGAFIARDQFRRDMYRIFDRLKTNALRKPLADSEERYVAELMLPVAEAEYHRAANSLFDEGTWKSMGAFQQAANGQDGWVGLIDADRVGLAKFASLDRLDYGDEILRADPEKIRSYLQGIDAASLRDGQIRRLIEKRASMVKTIKEGLDLTDAQKATADRVLKAAEQSLSALEDAEKVAIRLNKQAVMNEADKVLAQGGLVTKLLGGIAKVVSGDPKAAAALWVGGQETAAKQAQAVRIASQGSDSRMVRGILRVLNFVSGEGSPNGAALGKIERRARAGGIIDESAEKLANRMRDQNYALGALFRPLYDGPAKDRNQARGEAREIHARRREVLAELVGDPAAMARATEAPLARAAAASPQMGTQLAEEVKTRIDRLHAALPGQDLPSLLPAAPRSKAMLISDQELRQADAYIQATIDPLSVFEDFERGHLDYDKLRFAKEQYPEMFQAARAMALDIFRELPADIRGNMATQLDFLLDFEGQLDPTLSPEFLKRQQERLELQQQKTSAAAQNPPPRPAPGRNTGVSAQTYTQRLAGV
jgi:hypothetical protein